MKKDKEADDTRTPGAGTPVVRVSILTFSDTRTEATDSGGALLARLVAAAGHEVTRRRLVREDVALVRAALLEELSGEGDAILTTGGTGIAARDVAIDVLDELLERRLDGFGEAFRRLSWDQVGARSLLSRAMAGTARGKLLVALPGSEKAVALGVTELLLPFLPHAIALLRGTASHGAPETASGGLFTKE